MKTVGIICEYNPFHLGHARQLRLVRDQLGQDCKIIGIMSGNYVQRGEPAMWDKYTRAQAAVACGVDLVLELPITGVLQSAEGFAQTGVEVLSRLGCVDILSFGAECGNAHQLMELAAKLCDGSVQFALREGLTRGLSYAAASQAALGDTTDLLHRPNNILGLVYCRAILRLQSDLTPLAIPRGGDYHAEAADAAEPSATAVRNLFPAGNWNDYVPEEASRILREKPWYALPYGERAVLARLRSLSDEEWASCAHGSEGLWSKAMKAARSRPDYESIANETKSKRYPRTRIQRLLLCAYLGITADQLKQPVPYARILAANTGGRSLLRQIKDHGNIPLINPGETPDDRDYYRMECRCSDLYTLFAAPGYPLPCQTEQTNRLRIE